MMNLSKPLVSLFTAIVMAFSGCSNVQKPDAPAPGNSETTNTSEDNIMELTEKNFPADEQNVKLIGRTGEAEGIRWLALHLHRNKRSVYAGRR